MQSRAPETEARGRRAAAGATTGSLRATSHAPAWQQACPRYRLADCNYSRELEKTFMTNDNAAPPEPQAALLRLISETLRRHGGDALHGDATPDAAARAWLDAGFADPEEVDDWLAARCFDPRSAQALDAAGLTPEQAALRTRAGSADYEETVAYKLAHGDLTVEEARRIITNDFWNS